MFRPFLGGEVDGVEAVEVGVADCSADEPSEVGGDGGGCQRPGWRAKKL